MIQRTIIVCTVLALSVSAFLLSRMATAAPQSQEAKPSSQPLPRVDSAGGMASGGAHAAVLDALNRPITAGGFVDSGPIVFQDISGKAGITGWKHSMGGTAEKTFIIEENGSGVGLIDYDNDGWLDIYLVNGSTYEALKGNAPHPRAALFHNNHDGTFTDVAAKAGVTNERWGFGVAVGDYDNDGWPDLFVTNFGKNRLYHNNHDGTFTDVAEKAGVTLGNWSNGPTFGDYDGDGRLDLFVPGYIHYDVNHPPLPGTEVTGFRYCVFRGVNIMCGPRGLQGEPDHLFHNNGDGTFTDVSEKAGVADKALHYGITSLFADVNNDGKPDLLVTNDSTSNYLYLNKGDGTFEDASYASGFAFDENGHEKANMGLAVGDLRHTGWLDIYVTAFSDDYNPFYRNDGDANLSEVSYQYKIAEPTMPFLGWGDAFIDFDNDGWLDIFVANGHVYPFVDKSTWGTTYAQRPLLIRNLQGTKFEFVPPVTGTGLAGLYVSRGAAVGDLFNSGKMDVVINQVDRSPVILRNVNADTNHWVGLKLIGGSKSPRDAVGATVYLKAAGTRRRGDVLSGGSYASSHDQRLHFGLGESSKVEDVEIRWPSGAVQHVALPRVDRFFAIEEGKGIVPSVYDKPAPAVK